MCFHTREQFDAWVVNLRKSKERESVGKSHEKSERKYALIALRCEKGEFIAGWHCDPRDPQDVANTIMDLKSWHAGEYKYVDTRDVDNERKKLNLAPLDQDGLPLPNRLPQESIDNFDEEKFREVMAVEAVNVGIGVISSPASRRATAKRLEAEKAEEKRREEERIAREAQEAAMLSQKAAELGITPEQMKERLVQMSLREAALR